MIKFITGVFWIEYPFKMNKKQSLLNTLLIIKLQEANKIIIYTLLNMWHCISCVYRAIEITIFLGRTKYKINLGWKKKDEYEINIIIRI